MQKRKLECFSYRHTRPPFGVGGGEGRGGGGFKENIPTPLLFIIFFLSARLYVHTKIFSKKKEKKRRKKQYILVDA